ncbi:hypothetical protein ABZ743_31185 [Streptomyces sp. NPDC006662]|uniref:hypothetical protein n=1 Tax=Streptomyces sp. NPDC006662 TaxID=3156902 RepID=UPI0033FDA672
MPRLSPGRSASPFNGSGVGGEKPYDPENPTVAGHCGGWHRVLVPAHQSSTHTGEGGLTLTRFLEAADVLALLCDQIGKPLEHGLAARRYAMSGDRRALQGTVL